MYSFVKCGCSIYCFSKFRESDISRYGYLEMFQRVPWTEITKVDCMYICKYGVAGLVGIVLVIVISILV